jgi:hypothetical protein
MRTGFFTVFVLFLAVLPVVSAQEAGDREITIQPPASQQDAEVKNLENKIQIMQLELLKATESQKEATNEKIESLKSQLADQRKIDEDKAAARERQAKKEAAAREAEQAREKKQILGMSIAAMVLLIIAGTCLISFFARRGKNKIENVPTLAVESIISQTSDLPVAPEEKILVDPTTEEVKEFSRSHGYMKMVPIILPLKTGQRLSCIAEIREGQDHCVHFVESKDPATWRKRYEKAEKILGIRSNVLTMEIKAS